MIDGIFVVGITGPTGAGKSAAAREFVQNGFFLVDTDVLARQIVMPDSECLRELAVEFSDGVLNPDGSLNRRMLAQVAFASDVSARKLNEITHPYILALSEQIIKEAAQNGYKAAVIDAALLFESGGDRLCDRTVCVTAPQEVRLTRIMKRDGLDAGDVLARMAAQQPAEYYRERADYMLDGGGAAEELRRMANKLAAGLLAGVLAGVLEERE